MHRLGEFKLLYILMVVIMLAAITGCVVPTIERRPTLSEARLGQGRLVADTSLQPGETRGEVVEIQPAKTQIHVRADGNRTRILEYDPVATRLIYHGREYGIQELQAGDVIAFQPSRRGSGDYVATVRLQEPVQARAAGPSVAQRTPPPPRPELIDGTVERIDYDRGVFDVKARNGSIVTVALPYNAKPADVDAFRRLRRGDYVKVEGEFINRDNFQLLAFAR
jgi:hypothetical protein